MEEFLTIWGQVFLRLRFFAPPRGIWLLADGLCLLARIFLFHGIRTSEGYA